MLHPGVGVVESRVVAAPRWELHSWSTDGFVCGRLIIDRGTS